jgi:hypothetical protein
VSKIRPESPNPSSCERHSYVSGGILDTSEVSGPNPSSCGRHSYRRAFMLLDLSGKPTT